MTFEIVPTQFNAYTEQAACTTPLPRPSTFPIHGRAELEDETREQKLQIKENIYRVIYREYIYIWYIYDKYNKYVLDCIYG